MRIGGFDRIFTICSYLQLGIFDIIRQTGIEGVIMVNEFNEYVHEVFSTAGDIAIKSMMGGWFVIIDIF